MRPNKLEDGNDMDRAVGSTIIAFLSIALIVFMSSLKLRESKGTYQSIIDRLTDGVYRVSGTTIRFRDRVSKRHMASMVSVFLLFVVFIIGIVYFSTTLPSIDAKTIDETIDEMIKSFEAMVDGLKGFFQ